MQIFFLVLFQKENPVWPGSRSGQETRSPLLVGYLFLDRHLVNRGPPRPSPIFKLEFEPGQKVGLFAKCGVKIEHFP